MRFYAKLMGLTLSAMLFSGMAMAQDVQNF